MQKQPEQKVVVFCPVCRKRPADTPVVLRQKEVTLCEHCVVTIELEYATSQAVKIPALEQRLRELDLQELTAAA